MEFRRIRPDEVPLWRQFQEYCFHTEPADFDPWMANKFQIEHTRSLFTDGGQMAAACANYPWELHFEGARLGMGAIASVASLPENRRGGHVGRMIQHLIIEMKERGIPLSALYPFHQGFYRRYGWDVACSWIDHEIPVELLGHLRKYSGVIDRHLPGQADWREIAPVYRRWAASRRGYVARETEHHWRTAVYTTLPGRNWHTAVYRPSAGAEPEGYLLYRFANDAPRKLQVRELVALNPAAERALWGFMANHDSQVKFVKLRQPRTWPLWHLVDHTDDVKSTMESGWMLRLIDLKAAIEARPWPGAPNGSLVIGVTDEQAPWNAGTWRLEFEDGRAAVNLAPAETPSLSANVQTWAQWYAGFIRPKQAVATGNLSGTDARSLALLAGATAGEEMFFFEFF
jgi:predicted acetyltransferase